jgi:hypothetical protein
VAGTAVAAACFLEDWQPPEATRKVAEVNEYQLQINLLCDTDSPGARQCVQGRQAFVSAFCIKRGLGFTAPQCNYHEIKGVFACLQSHNCLTGKPMSGIIYAFLPQFLFGLPHRFDLVLIVLPAC